MSPLLFTMVLLAAFLHASWNLLVKISPDRFEAMFLLQGLFVVIGAVMLLVFPFPAQDAWGYVLLSGVLHTAYNVFLARSYKFGDLGLVYPVARGAAPLLTLLGSLLFIHDQLSSFAMLGIIALIAGIWLIALSGDVLRVHRSTFFYALATSVFIGCYTVVDGLGARAAGNASGYTGLAYVFDGLGTVIAGVAIRGPSIFASVRPRLKSGMVAAAMSGSAYWIIIWAMAHAPIAAVAALRETSILFAMVFSAKLLKEPLGWKRIAGAVFVVAGAMALRA